MESSTKSNSVSNKCRSNGNELYIKKKFFDAILKYNESLCYAETQSENMGLSYANRSAVYFEMKLFNKALNNIQLARVHNYPEKNMQNLNKREAKCYEMIKTTKEPVTDLSFFKLSYEPNENCSSIAKCLEIRENDKYGRHIITKRPLSVGEIIAIEDPIYKVIKSDERYSTCYANNVYQRCSNCLSENLLDLIPCTFCTKTMFCSLSCMEYSLTRHHKYECPIIDKLLKSGIKHMILRIFFEGISIFDHDVTNFKSYIVQNRSNLLTAFHNGKLSEKDLFLAVLSLGTHVSNNIRNEAEPSFEEFFEHNVQLKKWWKTEKSFVTDILSKLSVVGKRDIHGIGAWSLKKNGINEHVEPKNPSEYQELIGNACYLFSSLLNHSCAPNIKRLNVNCKNIIIVSRPISADEQLFDSYRQSFNLLTKHERQEALQKDYGFICDCEACANDWPLNKDLEIYSESLLEYAWESYGGLPFLQSCSQAIKKFRELCEKFSKHHGKYPSAELIIIQECFSNCLLSITRPSFQFC